MSVKKAAHGLIHSKQERNQHNTKNVYVKLWLKMYVVGDVIFVTTVFSA